jgi:hypothetical protein
LLWHFYTCRYHNRDQDLCTTESVQNKHSYWNNLICLCNCTRSLAKLPPCEATFHQHVLRAYLQTYIWKSSQKAQSPVRSPLMFGWENKGGLVPVFFLGQMSSHFLQDLVSNYKMTIVELSRHYMADNFVHNNKAL